MKFVKVTLEHDGVVDTFKVVPTNITAERGPFGDVFTMCTESGIEVNISRELYNSINNTFLD